MRSVSRAIQSGQETRPICQGPKSQKQSGITPYVASIEVRQKYLQKKETKSRSSPSRHSKLNYRLFGAFNAYRLRMFWTRCRVPLRTRSCRQGSSVQFISNSRKTHPLTFTLAAQSTHGSTIST